MTKRWKWRGICAGLITSAMFFCTPGALAAEKLIWLVRDLPPMAVHDGPNKDQGIIDRLLPVLIANMPQYEHVIQRVNRARSLQMLEGQELACDPMLVWNQSRAQHIVYSNPIFGLRSNGLAIRRTDEQLIAPFVHDQAVDLPALLSAQSVKLGLVAKRSYGVWIDDQLSKSPRDPLFIHYGNDAIGSLLQMQHAGRLPTLLGYWPEIQSKAKQYGLSSKALAFYPIQGAPAYQTIYAGCTKTPQGQKAIADINTVLGHLPRDSIASAQTFWIQADQADDGRASAPLPVQEPTVP